MKGTTSIALMLLILSPLAFYVFAQTQNDDNRGDVWKTQQNIDRLQEEKQKMVREMLLVRRSMPDSGFVLPQRGKLLLLGIGEDGKVDRVQLIPGTPGSSAASQPRKLRFEMQDGSIQEIDLKKLKKITVNP